MFLNKVSSKPTCSLAEAIVMEMNEAALEIES